MSSPPVTEQQLIRELSNGSVPAFRELFERYQGKVFLFALQLTKSRADAEEVVQEVFVRIWEKRDQIRIEKNFNGYLLTIARNLIIDKLKQAARDKILQQRMYQHIQALQKIPFNSLIEKELARLHQQAIERLSARKKIVYLLSREEELTYGQIAERLGISVNTVRNQMSSALQSIREYLSQHSDLGCIAMAVLVNRNFF